jgi:hypothetical protein
MPFPWKRPRLERTLLVLVALATLTPVYAINAQDVSRLCLTRSLVHLRLSADACLGTAWATDRAQYGRHLYSDKAPGMSVLEIPGSVAAPVGDTSSWPIESVRLWLPRVLSSGIAFLLGIFLVGRISEGLAPGLGGISLVTFGLGTLFAPFAAAGFEHVTAGTLGLATLALAWRRRPALAGVVAGVALLVAYEAALILLIVAIYLAFLQGACPFSRYALGALPGVLLLCAYDRLAFGAPWHLSYDYIVGANAANQDSGFFGIHLPRVDGIRDVFVGAGGLLPVSPVLLASAYGLVLLGRRYRAEAIVCGAVTAAFLFLDCGYFAPYGGLSPGPRFVIPCLPFLALGLSSAFARSFRVTALLAALSVVATTAETLTWVELQPSRGTIWARIVDLPVALGSSAIVRHLTSNVVVLLGSPRGLGAVLVVLAAAAAMVVSSRAGSRSPSPRLRGSPPAPR